MENRDVAQRAAPPPRPLRYRQVWPPIGMLAPRSSTPNQKLSFGSWGSWERGRHDGLPNLREDEAHISCSDAQLEREFKTRHEDVEEVAAMGYDVL